MSQTKFLSSKVQLCEAIPSETWPHRTSVVPTPARPPFDTRAMFVHAIPKQGFSYALLACFPDAPTRGCSKS